MLTSVTVSLHQDTLEIAHLSVIMQCSECRPLTAVSNGCKHLWKRPIGGQDALMEVQREQTGDNGIMVCLRMSRLFRSRRHSDHGRTIRVAGRFYTTRPVSSATDFFYKHLLFRPHIVAAISR